MRTKIDYGIDLGTTNSAIARMENGKPTIKKSDILMDTTPSCVSINKKMDYLVGVVANNVMSNDNKRALKNWEKGDVNTYIEFKRMMGTMHSENSSNLNRAITPEELSAEVLKKLKSYVTDENLNSVVITVPAMFDAVKKDATMQAAKLAGFKHVELLQEPVAAVTAYGLQSNRKDGFWLVFDFGGGTFDAALIKAEDGILSVKDTAGDNWLGGKNLDYAVVDEIILPYLKENYAIDFVFNDDEKLKILRDAVKPYAEEAKNQLSFKDIHLILSNLGDLPFEDENGEEPEIDIEITQKEIERVLSPIFQKAIDITKDLLKHNNIKGNDIDALILVGGPTHSPILRRMLKEQITEKVDTSIDPMTAVATGAALFASTISVSEEVKDETRDKTKLQLEVNYSATSVHFDEMINVKILKEKTEGVIPNKVFIDFVRGDAAWSSGKKLISTEKKTLLDIKLAEGSNPFEILAYDEQGTRLECQPNSINILQGIGGLDTLSTLPYNIGIAKYFKAEDRDLFLSIPGLERTKRVPATGVRNDLKTRKQIRPGKQEDVIRIPIYMGERDADGTNPILNKWIYDVIITGESIPKLLPEGSDVEITIKVDRSEKMMFSAYFPLIEHTEELEIDIKNAKPPTPEFLQSEIQKAIRTAKKVNDSDSLSNLEKLESDVQKSGVTNDGKLQILDNLRKELLKLDSAEKLAEWPKVEKELKDTYYELADLIEKIKANSDDVDLDMDKIEAHDEEYKKTIEHIILQKDTKAAKELIDEIFGLSIELRNAVTGGDVDRRRIEYHDREFNNLQWKDKSKARQLVNQGLRLIQEGRTNQLKSVLHQIWDLRIDPGNDAGETLG
jgi:molecular chaperone DnaK